MGINFYAEINEPNHCECCGNKVDEPNKLHIGKSSYGWVFSLRVYPDRDINDLADMLEFLSDKKLWDEYEREVGLEYLKDRIVNRAREEKPAKWDEWTTALQQGTSPLGPNYKPYYDPKTSFKDDSCYLMRHVEDGIHCVGNGEGTWDYMIGEFS